MAPMASRNPSPSAPTVQIRFRLNGADVERDVPAGRRLVDVLRDDLGLTGTKLNCGIGVCGVCSVLVDGRAMTSCLLPITAVADTSVTTVEGLAGPDGRLSPVQTAFVEHGGLQCGICTPGQVIAATALLAEQADPDEDEIRDYMTGNLCRCTGYAGIIASIRAAAATMAGSADHPPVGISGHSSDGP